MLELEDFKYIINEFSLPIIVGELLMEDGLIRDARLVYRNKSFVRFFSKFLKEGDLFSSILPSVSSEFSWADAANAALKSGQAAEHTIRLPQYSTTLSTTMRILNGNLIAMSVSDISAREEREHQLKEQNERLATLATKLTESQSELQLALEKSEALNKKLVFIAEHDSLTELFNKKKLYEDLREYAQRSSANGERYAVILIDMDNMKAINDSQGHLAGDEFLRKCASLLKQIEREDIRAYRFGGDEFIVIVGALGAKDTALNTGDALLELFNQNGINFSAGIAVCPDDTNDTGELLKYADMAMYEVKKQGKNDVRFFKSTMQEVFLKKHNIESRIADALEREDFQLYYQPQFDIKTNALRGFEALLRWHDELLGWINPEQFIPVAEETRLVVPIGKWVLRTAIATLKEWTQTYNFTGIMSVNVSPVQLKQEDFAQNVKDWVNEFNIDPTKLELEITEGVFIDDKDAAVQVLLALRALGIGISLDDFGTGYSSLNYLQTLPITTLKIDKSFIANITENDGAEANITNSIVSMVTKLGLNTIAEGVEKPEQLNLLDDMNCKTIQGFLKGKPMPQERCAELLSQESGTAQETQPQSEPPSTL